MGARRLIFLGSKAPGLAVLEAALPEVAAVVTPDDAGDARSVMPAMRDACQERGIEFHTTGRDAAEGLMRTLRPDLVFVSGWYWLLSPTFLRLPPLGVVGIHHSLLPRYRGGAPLVWAMLSGESRVGTSLFHFGEGMDDGDIVDQRAVDVGPDDAVGDVLKRLEAEDVSMARGSIKALLAGTAPRRAQDASAATYGAQRVPAHGRIEWRWPARRVHDFIRAQSRPYPGAWTRRGKETVVVERASVFPHPFHGIPGQTAAVVPEGVLVCCGEGTAVVLRSLRFDGGDVQARDVLKVSSLPLM